MFPNAMFQEGPKQLLPDILPSKYLMSCKSPTAKYQLQCFVKRKLSIYEIRWLEGEKGQIWRKHIKVLFLNSTRVYLSIVFS